MVNKGFFGDSFDFNNNGQLEAMEQAADFAMFMQVMESEKNDSLISAGLNPDELENMEYFERRESLEEAGLNPDDFE